jgi:hypothetical protein
MDGLKQLLSAEGQMKPMCRWLAQGNPLIKSSLCLWLCPFVHPRKKRHCAMKTGERIQMRFEATASQFS